MPTRERIREIVLKELEKTKLPIPDYGHVIRGSFFQTVADGIANEILKPE